MIARLVLALVVAIVVGLVCLLVGTIIESFGVPIATTVGGFLVKWGWVLGALAGLYDFFSGGLSANLPHRS